MAPKKTAEAPKVRALPEAASPRYELFSEWLVNEYNVEIEALALQIGVQFYHEFQASATNHDANAERIAAKQQASADRKAARAEKAAAPKPAKKAAPVKKATAAKATAAPVKKTAPAAAPAKAAPAKPAAARKTTAKSPF